MNSLKEMLTMDPCYEQHIVSIKQIYEEHLFSIIVPAIYEGFQSLYKYAYEIEKKYESASKRNPDVENPGILTLFKQSIKQVPSLNTHRIRIETDRIKSSTKSAEIFDDLIRAVCKSNIILLTYNVDHTRKTLLQTKYHENIIIHDFVHSCYVQSARLFSGQVELFCHKQEISRINQNKSSCYRIITDAVKEAIRLMLPMKEILIEYVKQKYEQKEKPHVFFANNGYYPGQENTRYPMYQNTPLFNQQAVYGNQGGAIKTPSGVNKEEFLDVNHMIDRDLKQHTNNPNHSLLDDDDEYDPANITDEDNGNNFSEKPNCVEKSNFSLLLGTESHPDRGDSHPDRGDSHPDRGDPYPDKRTHINESLIKESNEVPDITGVTSKANSMDNLTNLGPVIPNKHMVDNDKTKVSESDKNLKLIDISSIVTKKGPASTYFNETMPDIQKRVDEYNNGINKNKKESKQIVPMEDKKESKQIVSVEDKKSDEDIKITRSNAFGDSSPKSEIMQKKKLKKIDKSGDKIIDDFLKV